MSGTVGIAILGAGIFAREQHLPAVLKCEKLRLKAVYSRSRASTENFVKDAQKLGFSDKIELFYDVADAAQNTDTNQHGLEALLARSDIQAVIIALPILTQPEVIRKCLKSGKHVLCEKPIAGTAAEGEKLVSEYLELQKSNKKLIFSIAENWRYEPAMEYGAEVVAKQLGKLRLFSVSIFADVEQSNKYYNTAWRKEPEYQGGFLLDGGVHFSAALRLVVGVPVDSVSCFSRLNKDYLAPVDTVHAAVKLTDGTTGVFAVSFASPLAHKNITVVGEKGSVVIEPAPSNSYKVVTTIDGKSEEKTFTYQGVPREVEAFANAVISGAAEPQASAVEALLDVALIESLINSGSKQGQPIKVPDYAHLRA